MSLKLRVIFLCYLLLLSLSPRRSEASSICSGCAAALVGAVVAVGVGVGADFYFVHRSHTSLTGCISKSEKGLKISTKDRSYELEDAPSELKPGMRVALRGRKKNAASGPVFRVDHISRAYGACGA